ncbi:uncharacterized protein LOC142335194 [Convolutriloba macropyga]|uniref:uncharacterized protein LOC142335194 n=1 Tax=Convolutriloba macropyga TaxID=536237 RepID=UPI003F51BFE2
MLEKAIRIQQEQSMLGTTGGASSTAKDSKLQLCKNVFLQEYKAWQQCELGLGLCPPSDQMLLMPKVAKAGTDQEMSCVDVAGDNGVIVLKLSDICQYRSVARLKHRLLSLGDPHLDSEIIINSRSLSREQLMIRAAQYGLFNEAVLFSQTCGLDLSRVFEIMTDFYCEYHKATRANSLCAAYWLCHNSLPDEAYLTEDEQFKLMLLIKDHLETVALANAGEIHKMKRYYFVVLSSLLKNHCIVFTWLLQKIKEWGEEWQLAKLYLKFGYLFLSCQVSCSYLESQIEMMEFDESSKPYALFANTKLYRAQLHVLNDMKRKPSSVANGTEANEWHSRLTTLYEQYIEHLEACADKV